VPLSTSLSMACARLCTRTGACDVMAAAVLLFGVEVQSPIPNTFGAIVDWRVAGFTSSQPLAFASGDALMKDGADI